MRCLRSSEKVRRACAAARKVLKRYDLELPVRANHDVPVQLLVEENVGVRLAVEEVGPELRLFASAVEVDLDLLRHPIGIDRAGP